MKIKTEIKRKFYWILHILKRLKPYTVLQCYDANGNYEYSVLCLYKRLSSKCDNFIRIKYDARKCEMQGEVDELMRADILKTDR